MNERFNDKKPISFKEFKELRELVDKGKSNFPRSSLDSAEFLHPLNENKKGLPEAHIATAGYLFKCKSCYEIGMQDSWYEIILDTVGGTALDKIKSFSQDLGKGWEEDNIFKIKKEDNNSYFASSINFINNYGFVCDHCRDSCFDKNGNEIK